MSALANKSSHIFFLLGFDDHLYFILFLQTLGNRTVGRRLGIIVDIVFLDTDLVDRTRTADTAAGTDHAFNEVALGHVLGLFQQSDTAHVDTRTGLRLEF